MTDDLALERAAALLEESTDFRVLRRLSPHTEFNPRLSGELLAGIILDVETTGLDPDIDEIIELAMSKFSFNRRGKIGKLLGSYQSFNEPTDEIPESITRLTNIRRSDVLGKRIDPIEIEQFISGSVLVIAHNAAFDRPFVERVVPSFENYSWACSATELPWRDEGITGSKLEYIAQSFKFFYDAHRALDDCAALLNILSLDFPQSGRPIFPTLLENARRVESRLFAEGAAFDLRAILRRRGYKWNDGSNGYPRAWWRDLGSNEIDTESDFLQNLDPLIKPTLFVVSAKNRFSRTHNKRTHVDLG